MWIRAYATAARDTVNHGKHGLHPWPKTKKPTPHEIFNLLEKDCLNRLAYDRAVRRTYQKLVKLYHPDISKLREIENTDGSVLLEDQKKKRFHEVQSAYEILKSARTRTAYHRAQTTTWGDYKRGKTSSFDAYRMANAHRKKYAYENDPKFWQAGNWEDYYQMRYGRSAPTREEWEKNKWGILWKVLAAASVVVTLQVMLALEKTNEFNRQTRLMNLRANADLSDAYTNYDEGLTRFQRIRRFLLFRRLGLGDRDADGTKVAENEMLTKYAQEQLKRPELLEEYRGS
ncbi:hypothetical protein METBIDRAFT_79049 [Metschnikowia bicuspidata var. bicuspidata NRRL YB-4993]|uniref:J domain-containing protein n=1 Tax=Metschnikowia bicuspidata var. bicuspidata NRRL YB-4993 TaxID=869754 RepID=A0A1A0H9V1_9ASCO|nr:hypothetical protein METBIDRAFT_79049 [Metschnikowia bicuspidata var. bicuspidata NRRL YB-4993]OBA20775.1 hypothetical protein METBIDRAFT_79049 [Metschnikowia bicuspidata var. bicuspidata NRRL YB-4993]